MSGRFRRLFEVLDLGLEVLEVLLLPLSESSLGCPILGLAFLRRASQHNWTSEQEAA